MDSQNIKVYLGISFALIILFILILVIPFSKKPSPYSPTPSPYSPFPTSIETNPTDSTDSTDLTDSTSPIVVPADFTGVLEEPVPQQIIDLAAQKKDLKSKVPLNLTSFLIDFDYNEDKFVVFINDPKDTAQKEFESWRGANYPGLRAEQFLIK
ncbi:MAG: hypothetical protein AAB441_04525 [Patescibacteria group bacterium]